MAKMIVVAVIFLLAATMASAQGVSLGFGVSGGLNIPVAQDDQGQGTNFGIRGIVRPLNLLSFEANLNFAKYGDPDIDVAGVTNDLEGSSLTSYGVDAVLGGGPGRGIKPFFLAGIGFFKATRDQTEVFEKQDTEFGYSAGLGIGFGLTPYLALDVRGRANIVPVEGSSSRKSVFALVGLNYYLGQK